MVHSLVVRLQTAPNLDLAVLFGSYAKGTASAKSDVDVGVHFGSTSMTKACRWSELSRLEIDLSRQVSKTVEVVDLGAAPPLLRFEVAKDGVLLIDRTGRGWVNFRYQAMRDWYDWAPFARRMHRHAIRRLKEKTSHGSQ